MLQPFVSKQIYNCEKVEMVKKKKISKVLEKAHR